ncbi:hypothetical protein NOR_08476 [Metarhizium rileyi]|uniref:Protein kinase-like domain protein n=1 Tax=Metarhizium rileyi (strain RCEF 4871) TaxID=1649241 RepID=A0A166W8T2_METRR|nr:hypothetical protein NOR_08476 [Metarhizium rileyi RCEF 4871]
MSEKRIRELERQLEQSKAREAEARAREAEARAREAEARAQNEKRKNQKTTLAEYLHNCHLHLYQNLKLADTSQNSTGLATSVDGRFYPRWLRPWKTDTERQHQQHIEEIRSIYGEDRIFHEQSTSINIGTGFAHKKAGNEKAVEYFEKAVEQPTWHILNPLWKRKQLRQRYQCADLQFTDNIRDFQDESNDTQARSTGTTPDMKRPKLKPDGGGIKEDLDGKTSVAFVYDYKAAHKFSAKHLKAALTKETLLVDVHEWVLREQYAGEEELRKLEQEEARIAMALIQVFNYILWYGVEYGFVTAGTSLVQLAYDRAEPLVLRWRLCIPSNVKAQDMTEPQISQLSQTAVAQLASFCLLSLRSTTLTGGSLEDSIYQAKLHLKIWKETSYNDTATSTESDGDTLSSALPSRSTEKCKYPLRSRASCKDATVPSKIRDDKEGGDGDNRGGAESRQRRTRTGASCNEQGQGSSKSKKNSSTGSASEFSRKYCTQTCLLGLKHGYQLDRRCPNVLSHDVEGNGRHPLDATKFTQLIAEQLREGMYKVSLALDGWGKCGLIGVLFKLEMASFGYTFVGKGTTSINPTHLRHEGEIYQKLSNLQGYIIPVHLGIVSLDPGYLLHGGARVTHMMLMSWAGEVASSKRKSEAKRSLSTIYKNGVDHQDERAANLLWNAERRSVMVIDFHLASLISTFENAPRMGVKREGSPL